MNPADTEPTTLCPDCGSVDYDLEWPSGPTEWQVACCDCGTTFNVPSGEIASSCETLHPRGTNLG